MGLVNREQPEKELMWIFSFLQSQERFMPRVTSLSRINNPSLIDIVYSYLSDKVV
jgi:hypothetical protein